MVVSDIPKFRRVEVTLRKSANTLRDTIVEIDKELERKKISERDEEFLHSFRRRVHGLNMDARRLLADLHDGAVMLTRE